MVENAALLKDKKILIIEDDQDIAQLLAMHFSDIYQHISTQGNGLLGFQQASQQPWDLIILDIRLPEMDGLEICKQLRSEKNYTPILMLTSKSSELDQVLGFELGADDYVCKPFRLLELSARVKALLRRDALKDNEVKKEQAPEEIIKHGQLILDLKKRTVFIGEQKVDLTSREFNLLAHFAKSPGRVYSRMELLDSVWGISHQGYEHTVNSHINRLRSKLSLVLDGKHCIETVWGVGYKLSEQL